MIEVNISQSALGNHGCILELKRVAIDGYYDIPSCNIVYGEAIHKYRHIMFQTKGHIPTARTEALKEFNQPKVPAGSKSQHLDDANHMLCTAFNYWELFVTKDIELELVVLEQPCWKCKGKGYTDESLGEIPQVPCNQCNHTGTLTGPATELSFSIAYYQDDHIKVNLCGTLDGLGKIKGGCYVIPDLKTTSSWDKKGYFGTYKLSRQLRLYILALKLMAKMEPNSILGQIGATKVGARIDGLFIKPMANENVYMSSEVFQYSDAEIEAFQKSLDYKIQELSAAVKSGIFAKQGILNCNCIGKWGLCQFSNVCANSDDVAEILLKRDFKIRRFTPLNYSGI
jgi:hypothetical protein